LKTIVKGSLMLEGDSVPDVYYIVLSSREYNWKIWMEADS
jgi:hypothetical protein